MRYAFRKQSLSLYLTQPLVKDVAIIVGVVAITALTRRSSCAEVPRCVRTAQISFPIAKVPPHLESPIKARRARSRETISHVHFAGYLAAV
jgi:hypothetical protein